LACKYVVFNKNKRGNIKNKNIILLYFVLLAAVGKEGTRGFALKSGTATEQEYEDDHGKDDICKHYQLSAFFITCRKSWLS
jgi:hypothetical protein